MVERAFGGRDEGGRAGLEWPGSGAERSRNKTMLAK